MNINIFEKQQMTEKLNPQEKATVNYYNRLSDEWISTHSTPHYWNTAFERFHKLLPEGKLLEVGAGAGRDAMELWSLGYDYTGTEISQNMLDHARENNPYLTFLPRSVYELGFPDNSFDGFWAAAVLLHLPKDRVGLALSELHRVTRSGGMGFIAIKYGDGERVEADGRFFAYYSYRELEQVLTRVGLEPREKIIWPSDLNTTWLMYFVRTLK